MEAEMISELSSDPGTHESPVRVLLLVDDEPNILSALTRIFRRDAYQILCAEGGEAGLRLLEEHTVGVVISDQRMPGMTGAQFLARVKHEYPSTIRIMLSGFSDLDSVTEAINRGEIYRFLSKPWDDVLLREGIKDAFRYYELEELNRRLEVELIDKNERLLQLNEQLAQKLDVEKDKREINLHALQVAYSVFEYLPEGVLGIDDSQMIVIANRQAKRACHRDHLVGVDLAEITSDIDRLLVVAQGEGVAHGPITTVEGEKLQATVTKFESIVGANGWLVMLKVG